MGRERAAHKPFLHPSLTQVLPKLLLSHHFSHSHLLCVFCFNKAKPFELKSLLLGLGESHLREMVKVDQRSDSPQILIQRVKKQQSLTTALNYGLGIQTVKTKSLDLKDLKFWLLPNTKALPSFAPWAGVAEFTMAVSGAQESSQGLQWTCPECTSNS